MNLFGRSRPISRKLYSPVSVVFCVSVALIIINLFITQHTRPYSSDDLTWQNTFLTWRPFNGHNLFLGGTDTYIVRAPLLFLLGIIFSPGRSLLFAESVIFAILNFALCYYSVIYFLRKTRIKLDYSTLLPFIWLGSFGYYFARMFLNTNLRSFEVGLMFLTFVFASKLYSGEISLPKKFPQLIAGIFLSSLAAGALIYNDPYYLYLCVVPIAVLFFILFLAKKATKIQLITIGVWALLSLVFDKVCVHLAALAGVHAVLSYPVKIIPLDKLHSNLSITTQGMKLIFGAHSISSAQDLFTFAGLVNYIILALLILLMVFMYGRLIRDLIRGRQFFISRLASDLWLLFFVTLGAINMVIYTISTLAGDLGTYRYLIVMVFSWIAFMSLFIGRFRKTKHFAVPLLLLATGLNLALSVSTFNYTWGDTSGNVANRQNLEIINRLRSLGLSKGYAPYWDAQVNTYLSKGKVEFLPAMCEHGKMAPDYWLVDSSLYRMPAQHSFYVVDTQTNPQSCTEQQAYAQFGKASAAINIANKTILIYNYDIGSKQ